MPAKGKKAVVLLSGGVDSATVLFIAAERGYRILALTFDYGQRNLFEIESAKKLAELAGVEQHRVLRSGLGCFGGSLLTSGKAGAAGEPAGGTYVPGRNTVFLSYALSWAEAEGAEVVFYGANMIDFGGYPDCTEEFVRAFNELSSTALMKPVRVEAPVLKFSKREIVEKGMALGVDYGITRSCYFPDEEGGHCGRCRSCLQRERALKEAGYR